MENREVFKGANALLGDATLARQVRESPPILGLRADEKKPETSSGF
jgi:hypothetical protein